MAGSPYQRVKGPTAQQQQRGRRMARPRGAAGVTQVPSDDVDYVPDVDAVDTNEKFAIALECPGMTKDQITMDVRDSDLIVRGEREEDQTLLKSDHVRLRERDTGKWRRRIRLPMSCDTSNIQASFNLGVLEITIPKKQPEQVKRIQIQ